MRLALIGVNGMLAQNVSKLAPKNYEIIGLDLPDFDITDREQVLSNMRDLRPDVIVNCAAFTNVDGCESEEELATRVNGEGAGHLAAAANELGATLVHVSTDYVFDGEKGEPYTEEDPTGPRSAYGRSKLAGERAILESGLERFFILRTSWLYGPGGKNFVETIARLAKEREELRIVADQVGTPTYTEDLAAAIFNLLKIARSEERQRSKDKGTRHEDLDLEPRPSTLEPRPSNLDPAPYGIYHFSNEGVCSWHEFAVAIVEELRRRGEPVKARRVLPIRTEEYPLPAARPAYSVFSKGKYAAATGAAVPGWRDGLARYFRIR